jgi:hypothetical protein
MSSWLSDADAAIFAVMSADDRATFLKARQAARKDLAKQRRTLMRLGGDDYVSAAIAYLSLLSSEKRGAEMLPLVSNAAPETFLKIFFAVWPNCDRTSAADNASLLRLLAIAKASSPVSAVAYLSDANRAFWQTLPTSITVFRGCSRCRVDSLSWTTDKEVAKGFARGHRAIVVGDPVLVTANVKKDDVLAVFTDRRECEVICVRPPKIVRIEEFHEGQHPNLRK